MTHAPPPDNFARELNTVESGGARIAQSMIERGFEHQALPTRDENGVTRAGFNRPIEKRARDVRISQIELRSDLQKIRVALRPRVFSLMAKAPVSELRLGIIYALADIIDVKYVMAWEPLWHALERHDWPTVVNELLNCNWDGLVGSTQVKKSLFSRLITGLMTDTAPAGLLQ